MFTIQVKIDGIETSLENSGSCANAWRIFGEYITAEARLMRQYTERGDVWQTVTVRMAYMIDTPAEVEYASVTMA